MIPSEDRARVRLETSGSAENNFKSGWRFEFAACYFVEPARALIRFSPFELSRVPFCSDLSCLKAGASTISQSPQVFQGPRALGSPLSPVPVESSKYWFTSSGVGGMLPMEKRFLPMLSRAAVNAFK